MATTNKKIIKIGKELTDSKIDTLEKKLRKLPDDGDKEVVLDFAKVDTIDFTGLGLILATRNTMKRAGGNVELANIPEPIHGMFQAMRLDRYFEISMQQA